MHQLIGKMFAPAFSNKLLNQQHDGAAIDLGNGTKIAFTTDSFVVSPLFFPGGNIGTLAVNGTVNDLAMCGAKPLYLSAGFIIEEGLPMETLWQVVHSMSEATETAGVQLVTGDTKVVDRGKGDGIYINTAGIGLIDSDRAISPTQIQPGDKILINGDLGRHGMAIMAVREGLEFETEIKSDCAPLVDPVFALLDAGIEVHCLRDLTRGGLATTLVEIAESINTHLHISEAAVPVREDVRGACEILGFDPFYVANEGRFMAFVPPDDAGRAIEILRQFPDGDQAAIIGDVTEKSGTVVTMKSQIGATRILDMLSGEQLPRIC
ncbi:MAG: hydrogenase expression/formation protein HypE [Gemmatimonadetes bacterium]|nr:MAG: hydrogenase expression/formation protein HypE [Gemmatimonadota bacterium]